jgi:dTDP-4-dehydrorhamnose 3,5-epimerase
LTVIFQELSIPGAWLIEPEKQEDQRGFFARAWCRREFAARGLSPTFVQGNISFNKKKGTLRGLHYQAAPAAEAKLIMCLRGALYDVIVDLRLNSPTYLQWVALELTGLAPKLLYIPEGYAHGFQTMEPETEVFYLHTEFFSPEHERGIRYNDPTLSIRWPLEVTAISERDRRHPYLHMERNLLPDKVCGQTTTDYA